MLRRVAAERREIRKRDLATLLVALKTNTAASRASSDSLRAILLRQEFNDEIPAGLPPGMKLPF